MRLEEVHMVSNLQAAHVKTLCSTAPTYYIQKTIYILRQCMSKQKSKSTKQKI